MAFTLGKKNKSINFKNTMATIIKLTYTITGKKTLVNVDKMTTSFRIFERSTKKYATRINFDGETYVIVDETLQEIKTIIENMVDGTFQSNDWFEEDSVNPDSLFNRLEFNYNTTAETKVARPRRKYQELV
jgi:hypothetical protein